ncbi:MAG TPA: hypothetical protein VGT08_17805 [Terracidiphilus sp.]|nr:hypothetical protein [Terracidiphilus sp.]
MATLSFSPIAVGNSKSAVPDGNGAVSGLAVKHQQLEYEVKTPHHRYRMPCQSGQEPYTLGKSRLEKTIASKKP